MASSKQVVGNPTPRVEGELKVSGEAKYAVDITVPGMLWGKLLRSPIASGKIKSINTNRAEELPGVHAVVTGQNCTGLKIGRRLYDMPILATAVIWLAAERHRAGDAFGTGEVALLILAMLAPIAQVAGTTRTPIAALSMILLLAIIVRRHLEPRSGSAPAAALPSSR